MKTTSLKIIAITVVLFFGLSACSKDDSNPAESNSTFVGTWKLTKLSALIGGAPLEMTPELAGTQMTITAKADNTFSMTTTDGAGTRTSTGTWSISGSQLTLKFSDGTSASYEYSLSGSLLKIKNYPYTHPTFGSLSITLDFTKQ
ncbi:MAG: lipocalin family protein [Bacteroidota bacterium]